MVKKTMRQFVRHCIAGIAPFVANIVTFTVLVAFDVLVEYQTVVAFVIGGQVAFWAHDRWSYRHRQPSIDGWQYRWLWFMPGQIGGAALNWWVADWLTDRYDLWTAAVYVAATCAGVTITFTWTNCVSHKDDESTRPVEQPLEHAQN